MATTGGVSGEDLELAVPEYCKASVIQTLNMPKRPHLQTEILNSFSETLSSGANIEIVLGTEGLLEVIGSMHTINAAGGGNYRSGPRIRSFVGTAHG